MQVYNDECRKGGLRRSFSPVESTSALQRKSDNMKKMTEANLQEAFAGESQAHMKYLNFAEQARREKLPNIARLFEATAFSEQVHASNHLRALGSVQDSATNLGAGLD